jgi:site-specific DNA-adenine methylase
VNTVGGILASNLAQHENEVAKTLTVSNMKTERPFLKWAGGKGKLVPELLARVAEATPFCRYHEPFLGGGALYFALRGSGRLPEGTVLSDLNSELIEAFMCIRDSLENVVTQLDLAPA